MNSRKREKGEVEQELRNQLAALEASCSGYDSANFWEGPRIATGIYNIVNDGRKQGVSILSQLGIKSKMLFISYSTPQMPGNLLSWIPLCMIRLSSEKVEYVPQLDKGPDQPIWVSFREWWQEAVFENAKGQKLSRMNLVFALRSQDGGSHFDSELPITPYLELKEKGGGFQFGDGDLAEAAKFIPNAHLATVRHIAFELQQSISAAFNNGRRDSF